MLKKLFKNEKGLTLVELLAVIVILGIIAGIAVPSVMNIIQKSKVNAVKADAIQILNAAKTYVASNGAGDNETLTITEAQLNDYVNNSKLNATDGADFTVEVSNGGQTFKITNTSALAVGGVTIKFTGATSKGIDGDNNYKGDTNKLITISN